MSDTIQSRNGLTVGDTVRLPGHRKNDPETIGTLVEIYVIDYPRSGPGYFVKVASGDRLIRAAFGLARKVSSSTK